MLGTTLLVGLALLLPGTAMAGSGFDDHFGDIGDLAVHDFDELGFDGLDFDHLEDLELDHLDFDHLEDLGLDEMGFENLGFG